MKSRTKVSQGDFFKLGEYEVKKHLKDVLLKEDRADGRIEEKNLSILNACRLRFFGGRPWRWEVGFNISNGANTEYYRAILSYPSLEIIGIVQEKNEFTGREAQDLTYIASPELIEEEYEPEVEEK